MTSTDIQEKISLLRGTLLDDRADAGLQRLCLWEIALQLALLNERLDRFDIFIAATSERYRLMVERYMELTASAGKSRKFKVKRQPPTVKKPTTVQFKTKNGKRVSMKALKTEVSNS